MCSSTKLFVTLATLVFSAFLLSACGTISKNVADDGSGADEIVWPDMDNTNALYPGGTAPTIAAIRNIHPGMSKKAIAELIGYPQYGEGLDFAVREWTYLFNLKTDAGWKQCQYKVLFDTDKKAQSFYWNPQSCAALVNGEPAQVDHSYTLGADALFDFDKATLKPAGQSSLNELATKLKAHQVDVDSIRITGYTDHLGSDSYNMGLSQRRADSVRNYLIEQGIPSGQMTAVGMGEANPVRTDCTGRSRGALIACLAPNRRVVVNVSLNR